MSPDVKFVGKVFRDRRAVMTGHCAPTWGLRSPYEGSGEDLGAGSWRRQRGGPR